MTETRALSAELLGTALLLYIIVGSGIAAERLSTDGAVQLLLHAVAIGVGLAALIAMFAAVSGSHFNPSVTLGFCLTGAMAPRRAMLYGAVQICGAVIGVVAANATFDESAVALSETDRVTAGASAAELIATFVLVLLILGLVRTERQAAVPAAVGAWITAIVLATVSTGFANPAVTIARMITDTYTGIAPASAPVFLVAELIAAALAAAAAAVLFPASARSAMEEAR